ncbi:MAG: fluoride efflux transporter CrcB [Crocinitomix sp.]|nr:fluoride efflux transporter CrcB [Crocinitomix sp.]
MSVIALIFMGGGLGSLARYGVGKMALHYYADGEFPMGTLIANTLACIILGVTLYVFKDRLLENEWIKYFIIIGFCGGFSTFSTFSLDTVKLFSDGLFALGVFNILISVILGISILWVLVKV